MSATNIKLIQDLYLAFTERELGVVFGALSAEVVVAQSEELPWGGSYRGVEGFREFFGALTRHISPALAIERYIDAGDEVVAIGRTQGTVVGSGAPFDVPVVHVWRLSDGKVTRFEPFIDVPLMQAALKAKGDE